MKNLIRAACIGAGLALALTATAFAKPEVVRVGNLFLRDSGGIFPSKLPRHRQAPVGAILNARIGTVDGSHPPAVRRVIAEFDKTIQVNARGLPACKEHRLVARSTTLAKRACPDSIVGSGEGEVEVAFPDQNPFSATGPVVLFNGGVRGRTTHLLIHAYVAVPAPTAVIVTAKITRINRGRYGLHTVSQIPRIAGGSGSVTGFRLRIKRNFTHKGRKKSYLTASCPTGRYYARGRVEFSGDTTLRITHVFPCTPRG